MANTMTSNMVDWQLFKRVVALAWPYRLTFVIASVLAILLAVLKPASPFIIQQTIDKYIMVADYNGLVFNTFLLIAVLAITVVFNYFFIFTTNLLGQSVICSLRVRVFNHITSLRLRHFDTTPIGQSTTRTINDVGAINDVFSQGLITIMADLLTIFMVLAIMFYTNWKLTLVCLCTFPFFIYATYIFKEKIKAAYQEIRNKVSDMNTFLQERISGMGVVQIFSAEAKEMSRFNEINEKYKEANIDTVWYYSIFFPVIEIITASALALLVWFGAQQVLQERASIGVLVAFMLYIRMLFRPMRMLADKFNTLQMGLVASDRVFQILDTEEKISNKGTIDQHEVLGQIKFDDVWFAYNAVDMVLKGVSFEVEKGKMLALVGATGAGKSSVINLLTRFYDIQKGAVYLDGIDLNDYDRSFLRSNIGVILQDVFLFTGSILENITLRNPNITMDAVVDAAKTVGAHDFIMKLPGAYEYDVRERGATLSMGQRQLISIVRTFVFDPRILILDEATSSIDTETEIMIQHATEKLMENRTSIIIAHRLSTIKNADQIIVLDKGEILEKGTHEELLALDQHYKQLHDMQFKEKAH